MVVLLDAGRSSACQGNGPLEPTRGKPSGQPKWLAQKSWSKTRITHRPTFFEPSPACWRGVISLSDFSPPARSGPVAGRYGGSER